MTIRWRAENCLIISEAELVNSELESDSESKEGDEFFADDIAQHPIFDRKTDMLKHVALFPEDLDFVPQEPAGTSLRFSFALL
jgi:hypothetical protein